MAASAFRKGRRDFRDFTILYITQVDFDSHSQLEYTLHNSEMILILKIKNILYITPYVYGPAKVTMPKGSKGGYNGFSFLQDLF